MYSTFYITHQKIERRLWVYLPGDYAITEKRYPVLYMQDGQNLFDFKTSFSGEWGIDEYLDSCPTAGIVIGIDNGGEKRLLEYNPNDSAEYGKGMGGQYLELVVTVLKPYVDKHFRTLPGVEHTAIAGSSMGGLISFYAGLFYPDVFGSVGVFSPSFWLVPNLEEQVKATAKPADHANQRYYFYAGGRETEGLMTRTVGISAIVQKKFRCEVQVQLNEKGTHSEASWKKMFPAFYNWLKGDG